MRSSFTAWSKRLAVASISLGAMQAACAAGGPVGPDTIAARQHYFGVNNVDPQTGAVRPDRVILSWTGVSNFAAALKGRVVLLNAFVARDSLLGGQPLGIWPSVKYIGSTPEELAALKPDLILMGHAHFDHAGDIPTVVRANPDVLVVGTAEHCADLSAEVPSIRCFPVFGAGAALGTMADLSRSTIPGVDFTAVKQPHSSAPPDPAADPPFGWRHIGCSVFEQYPVESDEPRAWGGPTSGSIAIAWQIRVGHLAITWQDTAGYIPQAVVDAFASLPPTDVRIASVVVSGRSALALSNSALRPKVFYPVHHDACAWRIKRDLEAYIQSLPASQRPTTVFMADPGDYLKPIIFDPEAKAWK